MEPERSTTKPVIVKLPADFPDLTRAEQRDWMRSILSQASPSAEVRQAGRRRQTELAGEGPETPNVAIDEDC